MDAEANVDLHNKVALVTGAGRGIGRALAIGLASSGARVAILARSKDQLDEVRAVITSAGGVAAAFEADVSDIASLPDVGDQILREFGAVDILVNNAAVVWPIGSTVNVDFSQWLRTIHTNVVGPARLTSILLPQMLERGWGRVVNVLTDTADRMAAMTGGNAYATSKAALEAYTLNLATELAGTGVSVNGFRPGPIDTAMQAYLRGRGGDDASDEVAVVLAERVSTLLDSGLMTPEQSVSTLLRHLANAVAGEVWEVPVPEW